VQHTATQAAAARNRLGDLSDFGDDTFREPLRILLAAIEAETGLTVLGRLHLEQMLNASVEQRWSVV
jgi:hypothetical protein